MNTTAVIKHLIAQEEGSLPVIKLVQGNHVELDDMDEFPIPKLKPSQYLFENKMTTNERHQLLSRQQGRIRPRATEVRVEPPVIVFQSYKYGETHRFPIIVRNVSKKSQKVALYMDESSVFKFDECSQRIAKFPCGMCIAATVTFTPESAADDYFHKLIVSSTSKKIVVPIVAIGARAVFDAPDSLFISDSPVRQWTVKPVTLLNIGKRTAKFTINITGPFCLKPDKGVAPPNHAFTFDIGYFSKAVASHEGEICIKYDTGEETYIEIKANAINQEISISSSDIRSEDTFIGLQTRSTIQIENKSNITAKFLWKKFETIPEKEPLNEVETVEDSCNNNCYRPKSETELEEDTEAEEVEKEEEADVPFLSCFETAGPILDEDLDDEKNKDDGDEMFLDENFNIYPLFGEVKPRSKIDVHVVFSPNICKFYEGKAYLDITGLEKRIPFQYYGRGLGPKFRLGFEELNVGEVSLGGVHSYEIPVQNISEIPGTIQFDGIIGPPSSMGMKVEPPFLQVAPSQYTAFYANFSSIGQVGEFEEEMKFSTRETGDAFYVTLKGSLSYPTIQFRTTDLNLGNLSFGFPKTFYMPLINESMNYVQVDLKMEEDGKDPPIDFRTLVESYQNEPKPSLLKLTSNPAEFKMEPEKFTLKPRAVQNIQLTIFPNQIRKVQNKVRCFITNDTGKDVETIAEINVRGHVIVPSFHIIEDILHVKECYIQFPRPAELTIQNSSELPVVYCIMDKTKAQTHGVKITSTNFVGVADPWMETKVPFEVTTFSAGEFHTNLELYAIGYEEKLQTITVKCESIPTKIEANLKAIDFAKVEVLEEKTATFVVNNPSPFQFEFTAATMLEEKSNRGEIWKVDPESGILKDRTKLTFTVKLKLQQSGVHNALVRVNLQGPNPSTIEVKLKAQGVGSPLVFDPPMSKSLDFGTIFINSEVSFDYTVTNKGTNSHILEWKQNTNSKNLRQERKDKGGSTRKSVKETSSSGADNKPRQPFLITPQKVIIPANGSINLSISAFCDTYKTVEENWNSWGFVSFSKPAPVEERKSSTSKPRGSQGATKKKKPGTHAPDREPQNLHVQSNVLYDVKLQAKFEAPGLKFGKRVLNFVIDAAPNQENFVSEEILKVQNIGTLPIKVKFRTKFPFSIHAPNETAPIEEVSNLLHTDKSIRLKIQFDGQHLRKELGIVAFKGKLEALYDGFVGADTVELRGVVRFPQLHLERSEINFGLLSNGMESVETITVTNPGSCCLTYKWYIKQGSVVIQKNPRPSMPPGDLAQERYRPSLNNTLMLFAPSRVSKKSLTAEIKKSILAPQRDHILPLLGIHPYNEKQENLASGDKDFANFFREKMYRNRLMEFVGLRDSEFEAEDEVNYLAFYNQNLLIPSFNLEEENKISELIDVIPLAGLIQAGQSQTFTFVFYGQPDIKFKASLVLYVEGGARRIVEVKGSTVPPYIDRTTSVGSSDISPRPLTVPPTSNSSRPETAIEDGRMNKI